MKMHKFEIYVIDFEDYGPGSFENEVSMLNNVLVHQDYQGTADIGEWDDDHPLNFTDTKIEKFREYFKK